MRREDASQRCFVRRRGDILGGKSSSVTMVSEREIAELELLASHCWPARQIIKYKGWIIHWNEGVTWRANSVLPNEWDSSVGLEQLVDYVIELYREKNTTPAFKITPAGVVTEIIDSAGDGDGNNFSGPAFQVHYHNSDLYQCIHRHA